MKYFCLVLSLLLTGFVFSMSFTSGADSQSMSLEITNMVLNVINNIFENNNVNLAELHIFIRKSAHIFEYMVIGISWFFTGKLFGLSFLKILIIGLLIASTDEIIQIYSENRGPSIIDTILFDFIPYAIVGYLLFIINNKKGKIEMTTNTLLSVQNNQISPRAAYSTLFKKKREAVSFTKKAHFLKLSIITNEGKGVNRFLKVLFFLPIPLIILKIILSFIKMERIADDIQLTRKEVIELISHKGIRIKVNTVTGEKILVKTI